MSNIKPKYDLDALKQGVKNCDRNIQIFQEAIEKEQDTKLNLKQLILEAEKEAKENGDTNIRQGQPSNGSRSS